MSNDVKTRRPASGSEINYFYNTFQVLFPTFMRGNSFNGAPCDVLLRVTELFGANFATVFTLQLNTEKNTFAFYPHYVASI